MAETGLHPHISRIGSELDPLLINGITGFLRSESPGSGLLTKPELDVYFDSYKEAARRGRAAIYIAQVAPGWMIDPELGGFAQASFNEVERGVHVEHLYVTNYARRASVGSLLLEAVIEDAQKDGYEYVQYDGAPDETFLRAHNFANHLDEGKLRLNLQGTGAAL